MNAHEVFDWIAGILAVFFTATANVKWGDKIMGFLSKFRNAGQIAADVSRVAIPIVSNFVPGAAPGLHVIGTALSMVNSVTTNGEVNQDVVNQLNALLIPYGFAIVKLKQE